MVNIVNQIWDDTDTRVELCIDTEHPLTTAQYGLVRAAVVEIERLIAAVDGA